MRRQLLTAIRILAVFSVLLGIVYPLAITAVARLVFPAQAGGSLVRAGDRVVGSALGGQPFTADRYFHPRPSATGSGHSGSATGGSNLGPTSPALRRRVAERVTAYREFNDLPDGAAVPVDAVTASGSGLDPHISVANAQLQAPRVAARRGLPLEWVLRLVDDHTQPRVLGLFGEPAVHVLALNLALDQLEPVAPPEAATGRMMDP